MKRILIIYEQIDTSVDVNIAGMKDVFQKEDLRFRLSKWVKKADIEWCDICFAIRPNSVYTIAIGKSIIQSGRSFASLFDDDLLNLPKDNSNRWKAKYVRQSIILSQYVICCNPSLSSLYKSINPSAKFIVSHPHVLEENILPVEDVKEKIRIIYPAGRDHATLFEYYVMPSIDVLYDKNDGKIDFYLIGIDPNISILRHKECIHIVKTMPLKEYNQYMKANRFDIGIAPLHDDPFCTKKYFNKYIEYAKCGIAGLYSNCLPYTYVVKDKENGLLVNNTIDNWRESLDYAIMNIREMKRIARKSQEHIKESFTLSAERDNIYKNIIELHENDRHYIDLSFGNKYLEIVLFEVRSAKNRIIAHIKSEGVIKTTKRVLHII